MAKNDLSSRRRLARKLLRTVISGSSAPLADRDRPFLIRGRAIGRIAVTGHSFSSPTGTGLRASEVGLLRVEDIELKALRIMVHHLKGSHSGAHPHRRPWLS